MAKPHRQHCPVARMLNIVGDHWTWLIVREAFYGVTRFSAFERNTGIAKNLLADRLARLVEEGIFEKRDVGEHGTRYAYRLTEKGEALHPVLIAMVQWGNDHIYPDGKVPLTIVERASGKPIKRLELTSHDGAPLSRFDLAVLPGPGAGRAVRQRLSRISEKPGRHDA